MASIMYIYLYSDYPETRINALKSMCSLLGIKFFNVYQAQKQLLAILKTTWSEFHRDLYLGLLDKVLEIETNEEDMNIYLYEKEELLQGVKTF